jgi:predicted MFS family arabinose efflux permease
MNRARPWRRDRRREALDRGRVAAYLGPVSARGDRGLARAAVAEPAPASWGALRERRYALPAAVVIVCTLSPAFGFFVTATVLPSAIAEIGGLAFYAWASTAYAIASILGSAGSLIVVRRTGTPVSLVIAAAVLVSGSIGCAMAPGMAVLVAGRALQGVGGGMMIAAVHGMVREVFPEGLWPRMLATISGAWGIAAMSGPAVGGVFAGLGIWRGAFWVMVPLAAAGAALTWGILPRAAAPAGRAPQVPLGRLGLLCAGVLCVASVANVGSTAGRVTLLAAAIAAIALMLRQDGAARDRLFPAQMLSLRRRVGQGFWMIFFVAMSTTPGSVYLPLLLQALHGVSPAAAGYFYAAQSLAWTAAAILSARLGGARARGALVLGPLSTALGFVGLYLTIAAGPIAGIVLSVLLVGGGIGACWAHVGSIVLGSGRHDEGAASASLIPTTQTFAVSLGAALCGIIANAAGLSAGATPPAAALAGAWLFGAFLLAPLAALAIASGLAAAGDGRPARGHA